ncbi:metalloregulator ArsR/SmtB family transcription factor [Micromonospora parva]|uniref:ArsR/SmtB family transcription factor n=1 Tax=Micromonospora parva TaxID=1464048 RepID=UPI0033EDA1CD
MAVRPLDADQAVVVAPMFKALGDPVRLRLMSMIASVPEIRVCDLTLAFDLSGPAISHYLKVLREAGLVDADRRGTWVWYTVRPEAFRQLGARACSTRIGAVTSTRSRCWSQRAGPHHHPMLR